MAEGKLNPRELAKLEEDSADSEENATMIDIYRDQIQFMQDRLIQIQENERWAFSEEDVKYYKENIAPYLVVSSSSIFTSDNNPAATSIQRYIDGSKDAASFISEIDRIVSMMQVENQ